MIPVLIGAAAVGVGAALLSDDDKNPEPEQTRQRVSENTVKRAMERSGRKIHTVDEFSNPTLEVFGHIQRIIVNQLGINRNEITMDSFIVDDLGADSLDIVELIMAVEEEFNIDIPDEQAEKMQTVGDVVHYILR